MNLQIPKHCDLHGFSLTLDRRYCTFVPPFFIDNSGAEFDAD